MSGGSHPEAATSSNAAAFSQHSDDVFGRIASRYDILCDLFSFGIHRLWKREVARQIAEASCTEIALSIRCAEAAQRLAALQSGLVVRTSALG
jgi:hypothetical protein